MCPKTIFLALCIVSISATSGGRPKGLEKRFNKDTDTGAAFSSIDQTSSQDWFGSPQNASCDSQYSCLNSSTARICAPTSDGESLYEIKRFTCPSSMPYCEPYSGTCTNNSPNNTAPIATDFICMRDGYFPDPNNCSRYYICQKDVAYLYTCEGYYSYYSVSTQSCNYYRSYCANYYYSCNGRSGVKIGTNLSPNNLFTYCVNSTAVAVDRCIGAYVFNQSNQTCVASCPNPGLFPRDDDCTKYYKCSRATHNPQDTTYIMTDLTCPPGQGFSETDYQCVNQTMVKNCNVPNSGLYNKK